VQKPSKLGIKGVVIINKSYFKSAASIKKKKERRIRMMSLVDHSANVGVILFDLSNDNGIPDQGGIIFL